MHIPVMYREVLNLLQPIPSKIIFDGTLGRGGHTKLLLQYGAQIVACDRDIDAYYTGLALSNSAESLTMHRGKFTDIGHRLYDNGHKFDGILLDLGMCSGQISDANRGFSFKTDGPLEMCMGDNSFNAFDVVNYSSYDDLCTIIRDYGEEHMYKRIAKRIIERRKERLFYTTSDLSAEICKCVHYGDKHPATRTFQAIRIFVNHELHELQNFLQISNKLLKPGGIIVIISFHSLEDRIVKRFFNKNKNKLFPQADEIRMNRRSRSAVLRYNICA